MVTPGILTYGYRGYCWRSALPISYVSLLRSPIGRQGVRYSSDRSHDLAPNFDFLVKVVEAQSRYFESPMNMDIDVSGCLLM